MQAVIVDTGGANLASLEFACERLGVRTKVSREPAEIRAASHVLLPGVGSASNAMCRLHESGLAAVLPRLTQPVLGICLGMQLLFEHSAEGDTRCLGILAEPVTRLQPLANRPVPHMGWNQLTPLREDPLLAGIEAGAYVFFVHSYAAAVSANTLASTEYGAPLAAIVRRHNFWGTQFHPERSASAGARLLANFMSID